MKYWQQMSITSKFVSGFGLLLLLILLIAITGYVALTAIRRQTEDTIIGSTEIQRIVLEMENRLEESRRLQRDFFLRYPEIGFESAKELYAQESIKHLNEVVTLSQTLKKQLKQPDVNNQLYNQQVDLNLYLSSAERYAHTFEESVELVNTLANEQTGLLTKLNNYSIDLRDILVLVEDATLNNLYQDMQISETNYLITRRRPFLQTVFNTQLHLKKAIQNQTTMSDINRQKALSYLENYWTTAEEIGNLDIKIQQKFNDFDLQAESVDPISQKLIALAAANVVEAQQQIEQINQGATIVLILVTSVGLVIATIIAIVLNNNITRNVVELANVANKLKQGNLEAKINIKSTDEIGHLATGLATMRDSIKEKIEILNTEIKERQRAEAEVRQLNQELENRVQQRTERLETIATLGKRLNTILDFDELLTQLVNQVKKRFNYYHVQIYILDKKQKNLVLRAGVGKVGEQMKAQKHHIPITKKNNLIVQVANSAKVMWLDNVFEADDWLADILLPNTKSEMAVPIINNKQVVGVLDVQSDKLNGLDEGDANLLLSLANHIAGSMTNARLFKQTQVALKETETLYAISQQMIEANSLSDLIATVVEGIAIPIIDRAVLGMFEYDEHNQMIALTIQANWHNGYGPQPTASGTRYLRETLQTLELFINPTPLFFNDMFHDKRVGLNTLAVARQLNIRALMVLPLHGLQQQLGVLLLEGAEPYQFNQQQIRPYLSILGQLATTIENKQLFSETVKAKEAAEIAKQKADNANKAKTEFLSSMSHELRTPLNGVLGYAQILKQYKLDKPVQDGLDIIKQSGEHLLTLITDILDLSKIEAGKLDLHPTSVVLSNFIQGLVGMIRMRAQQKNIMFSYQTSTEHALPSVIKVDEKRLRQILLNLLGNAIKFTNQGQVTLQIKVEQVNKAGWATFHFAVSDTGIGLTLEQVEKIFNPFEQVGNVSKQAEGTGLGLAISKQLVEAMGGQLQVKSKYGVGSTFWFELPLLIVSDEESETDNKKTHLINGYNGPRKTVLVVDDKDYNRTVLVGMLDPLDFNIITAEDGKQAIKQVKMTKPDIIFMDMIMPIMTGFEAVQKIRKIPQTKQLIIIGASASVFEEDRRQVYLVGCDGFLAKPVNRNVLMELLQQHLNLEWTYTDHLQSELTMIHSITSSEIATPLTVPPVKILQQFYELALEGDLLSIEEQIAELIEEQPEYTAFCEQLGQLASDFEVSNTVNFIERYLGTEV